MTDELKKYLLEQCRAWMLNEEIVALRRTGLTEHGEKVSRRSALYDFTMEKLYGFGNDKVNELVALGEVEMKNKIAQRLLADHGHELINNCPKCGGLARTPHARQCRHCGYDWH